jgi:hypothetical protein
MAAAPVMKTGDAAWEAAVQLEYAELQQERGNIAALREKKKSGVPLSEEAKKLYDSYEKNEWEPRGRDDSFPIEWNVAYSVRVEASRRDLIHNASDEEKKALGGRPFPTTEQFAEMMRRMLVSQNTPPVVHPMYQIGTDGVLRTRGIPPIPVSVMLKDRPDVHTWQIEPRGDGYHSSDDDEWDGAV